MSEVPQNDRRARFSLPRLLVVMVGIVLGAVVGIAGGLAAGFGYAYYTKLKNPQDLAAQATSVMILIGTVPIGAFMGVRYGVIGALKLYDRRNAREDDQRLGFSETSD